MNEIAIDQGAPFDMVVSKDDIDDLDGSTAGGGVDQDMYTSGDLQTFENNGPVFHQFRRKSIIPVDETVLTELSRHRSLDEVLTSPSTLTPPPLPTLSSQEGADKGAGTGAGAGTLAMAGADRTNSILPTTVPASASIAGVNHLQET